LFPQVQIRRAAATSLITSLPSTPIIYNRTSILINMPAFLRKSKVALLEHMKSLPDVHVAKEQDFVVWGHKFVNIAVSRKLIGGGYY
jgi:hypothetical protein